MIENYLPSLEINNVKIKHTSRMKTQQIQFDPVFKDVCGKNKDKKEVLQSISSI